MLTPIIMGICSLLFMLFVFRFKERLQQTEGMKLILGLMVMLIAGMPFILNGLFRERPKPPHSTIMAQSQKHASKIVPFFTLQGNSDVHTLTFSPDGRRLVSAGHSYVIQVWDVSSKTLIQSLSTGHEIEYVGFMPDHETILAQYMYGSTLIFWNATTSKIFSLEKWKLEHATERMFDFVDLKDGLLAGATYDENDPIRLWNLADNTLIRSFSIPPDKSLSQKGMLAISPNGEWLAATYNLHGRFAVGLPEIAIFHLATGKLVKTFQGHDVYWIRGLNFSSDGQYLASGGEDENVIVWDVTHPEKSITFTGHKDDITDVVFSPNNRWVVSVSGDRNRSECSHGDINVWDIQNRRGSVRLETRYPAWAVAFSPDGTLLAVGTACDDGKEEIVIWDFRAVVGNQ